MDNTSIKLFFVVFFSAAVILGLILGPIVAFSLFWLGLL